VWPPAWGVSEAHQQRGFQPPRVGSLVSSAHIGGFGSSGQDSSVPIPLPEAAVPLHLDPDKLDKPEEQKRPLWPHELRVNASPEGRRKVCKWKSGTAATGGVSNWDKEAHSDLDGDGRVSFAEKEFATRGAIRDRGGVVRGDTTFHPREILRCSAMAAESMYGTKSTPLEDVHITMRGTHPATYRRLLKEARTRAQQTEPVLFLPAGGIHADRSPFHVELGHSEGGRSAAARPLRPRDTPNSESVKAAMIRREYSLPHREGMLLTQSSYD